MLEIEILPLPSSGIDRFGYKFPVLRVNSFEYSFQCRGGCCFEFEYPKRFLGPIDFPARHMPAKAACVAQPLSLRQVSLIPPQRVLSPLALAPVPGPTAHPLTRRTH